MSQSDGTDTLSFIYSPDGQAIGVNRNGYCYYYLRNVQGDVIALYNSAGNISARYVYDSWGKLVSVTNANGNAITDPSHIANLNPIRYRGYYYDTETGLYYLQSRYYNPEMGRFLNADGILGVNKDILGYNLFTYCANNPVNRVDFSGYCHGYANNPDLDSPGSGVEWGYKCGSYGVHARHARTSMPNGGTINTNRTVQQEGPVTRKIENVTYIPPTKAKDVYIEKSKKNTGPSLTDYGSWVLSGIASTKLVAKKIPYLGSALYIYDGIRLYSGYMNKKDLERYELVMNKGKGVIVVEWAIEGARSGNGSWVNYYAWDGSSSYGSYPYVSP